MNRLIGIVALLASLALTACGGGAQTTENLTAPHLETHVPRTY